MQIRSRVLAISFLILGAAVLVANVQPRRPETRARPRIVIVHYSGLGSRKQNL